MAETVNAIVCELTVPKLSAQARNVADSLAAQAPLYQGCGATIDDIAAGYRLAAERVAAWAEHRDWPRLRDER